MRYCITWMTLLSWAVAASAADLGEGTDLEIGGPGKGHGKFAHVVDFTFDGAGTFYVLDGLRREGSAWVGNGLVQRFDEGGKFLGQFSVAAGLGDKNEPARLAVDGGGNVYVTQPRAGLVQKFDAAGKLVKIFDVPAAHAIAVRKLDGKEQVVVVPNEYRNNRHVEVRRLELIEPDGSRSSLTLGRPVADCQVIKADADGNLFLQAHLNQIYKFDPSGKLLAVLGGGTNLRTADGSELLAALAVDSRGNLYANTYGNPSHISRFNRNLAEVTQREGQFAWADAWGESSLFAVDRHDRLWVAALGNTPGDQKYHYRPCVMRLERDFFDPGKPSVSTHSTELLGLHLAVENKLPYGIAYDLAPASFELVVKPSTRRVHRLDVTWVVHDLEKNAVAGGRFGLPLEDGVEARHAISFTPPRWGWYTVTFEAAHDGRFLTAVGRHLGVTPKFPGMHVLVAGESAGGWDDPARQAFAGLPLQRVNTGRGLEQIEKDAALAAKYGLTLLVQFENRKECTPDRVREVVGRLKGRVRYWEIMNEPNFFMKPEEYVAMLRELYPLIKTIDPGAKVLGPTVCGIQLPWYEAFYQLGGKDLTDILSIHDYEGNEAVDPGHWVWKVGELRKIMARHGDAGKAIWQTERAIGGVRAENFQGGVQAGRVTLQRDVLETLGIPAEHNLHYYLNQAGYGTVPTYVWSDAGPHPAALATRTRQAMIGGRRFAGTLDFGPTGNKLFMGLRYEGADGDTITLRTLGLHDHTLALQARRGRQPPEVASGDRVRLVDSFGNARDLPVRDGRVAVKLSTMPVYLRLRRGVEVTAPRIDFGRNHAGQASFAYSAEHAGDFSLLTDGIFEAPHPSNPHNTPWSGVLPAAPQTLDIRFPHPRTIDRLLVYTVRADNPYCTLLDYDLQYHDGTRWVTIEEVRSPVPASNPVETPQCRADTWYMDENTFLNRFRPVTTDRLRLFVRRTTHGFMPDETAVKAAGWSANAPHLMLREVEVYGPPPAVETQIAVDSRTRRRAFTREPVKLRITNHEGSVVDGRATIEVPEGWKAAPAELPVKTRGQGGADLSFDLLPPAGSIPVGPVALGVTLRDARGRVLDFDRLTLTVEPPVVLSPREPGQIDPGRQELPVTIKNIGPDPVRGTVRIELKADGVAPASRPLAAEAPFGPVAVGQAADVVLRLPGLDLMKSGWRATYTVVANNLAMTTKQDLSRVRPWQVLGPFPNLTGRAFDKDFGPETGVDLGQGYLLPNGETARWKPALSLTSGFVDLNRLFKPNILVCAYAVTYVKSPTARKALVSAGSDDGGKLWLNGKLILSKPGSRSAAPGQDRATVELKEGWNEVLFKVPQSHGGWGFYFDLLTPKGEGMPDLDYRNAPPSK